MPLTKEKKEVILADYIEVLKRCSGVVVTEYRGLSVTRFNEVRNKLRDVGATYNVTKNTLFRKALKEVGMAVPEDLLKGPVAIGFAYENFSGTVKALLDAAKDNDLLVLKGAILEQSVFRADDLDALSKLPSLNELRAQLIGLLVQPASQLLSVLEAAPRDLVSVLAAYVDKHTEKSADEAA